jgi:chromosome segregation protein
MFKLQRLEITGFKSFADYTEIVFTGNGITAVVGPNGCGKSNVSDSIAWVLGEQKAKSLRGEEMKDVVFQGTSKRKSGGMAEVVLHLVRDESEYDTQESELEDIDESLSSLDDKAVHLEDFETPETAAVINQQLSVISEESANGGENGNVYSEEFELERVQAAQVGSIQTVQTKIKTKRHWKPRQFALDFAPGEAVSVTRRLYLSGESEYLLNGKSCRLRDIQDLFAGTGLSGAHYALIEQGRIGQILSAKPSDRRSLIEEAAGISKFRTRQRAAETRLESAKTNLSRISDIVSEIDKQANALRRQAAKTRRYKILREEFRQNLRQTFAAEGKHLTELVNELEEKLEAAQKIERSVFWEVAEKDDAFREATKKAREAEENLTELRARHSENALERDRNAREKSFQEQQIAGLKERSASLKNEIESIEQRFKVSASEIERLKKDERKERAEAEKAELDLRAAEREYQTKSVELGKIELELEAERALVLQHTAAFERLTEIERQLENNGERLKERLEGLRREGERAEETFTEHQKEAEKLARTLEKERAKLENLHEEKRGILEEAGKAREILKNSEKNLSDLRDNLSRKKNRLETLQELEERKTIYAPTVQKLFADQKKIGVTFAGTLADKFNVDEKAEKAIENLFGNFLQTVLVNSAEDARRTIGFLSDNNLGRIAVLVQDSGFKIQDSGFRIQDSKSKVKNSGKKNKIEKHTIADFLGVSDDFAELLAEVFPREMSAEMIENFDSVKVENDETFVTLKGDLNFGGKLFVGGKSNANEKNTSLLAFKRELRELADAAEKLNAEVEKTTAETTKAREVLAEKENKLVDLQSFIVKNERELLSIEIQAKSLAQEIERAERHKRVVVEEAKQIESETIEIESKRSDAKTNAEKAEKARSAASENLTKITERLTERRNELNAENARLSEKRTAAATSAERRRSAQTALRRIENEQTELESRLARQNLEILETEDKARNLTASIAEIERKTALAENEQTGEQNELIEMTAHLKVARETADAMSEELAELNKKSAEARNDRAALEIRQAEAVTRLKNTNEKCASELNLLLIELIETEEISADFDLDEARRNLEDLREKLENFGAINMLALEELAEIEERLTFLTAQRQDIIDGIAAAEAALKEIKQRSREKFREAFEAINRNFVEFFQELFGGGRGEMTLLEAEDVLEAGIEIVAQPPGKRLQSILLLSGGEKAMTAIALVMAIFQYRPAPFCLLDEVDAPLDDANVGRFVNKIAQMSEKTQFIVITHNKRTMEAAKALYGVTMQEAGVSKVVSVRFE